MSRREDRDSDLKRHRSRFDLAPSPKRSRRDGEPANQRPHTHSKLVKDKPDSDQKHRHQVRDQRLLEASSGQNSKVEKRYISKESENAANGNQEGTKHSSDPANIPRSQVYFQHDERGSSRQYERSFNQRTDSERGRGRNPREHLNERIDHKILSGDTRRKDDKGICGREDGHVWYHDGYYEMEANPKPPLHKRRSFREQKITTAETEKTIEPAGASPVTQNHQDHAVKHERRDERMHHARYSYRPERLYDHQEKESTRKEARRDDFSSKYRYDASTQHRGRDQFTARPDYRSAGGGGRVEKWKHDLYQEANRSLTPKNDEDQISKIEALLAS